MSKIVLLSFVFLVAIILSVECQTSCQSSTECPAGECCGVSFQGVKACTKMRAQGDICWHYGLRDYPQCMGMNPNLHNCADGLKCLPRDFEPEDPRARDGTHPYICK